MEEFYRIAIMTQLDIVKSYHFVESHAIVTLQLTIMIVLLILIIRIIKLIVIYLDHTQRI